MVERDARLVSDLIRIPSQSGNEEGVASYILDWFQNRNIDVFVQDGNVVAKINGTDNSKAFIFNAHMDTVAPDDQWTYDPWGAEMVADKIYGLGASDMKIGLAATMRTAEKIVNQGSPPVDIWFTYVTREEVDGYGTKSFAEWVSNQNFPYKECAGIVAEPTDLKEIAHGHRGNMFLKATSKGTSGHASKPIESDLHSVRTMVKFADAIAENLSEWNASNDSGLFEPPTVGEFTSIEAGLTVNNSNGIAVASPNKFPASCVATFDIRTVPNFSKEAFNFIQQIAEKVGVSIEYLYDPCPAGFIDPSDRIVQVTHSTAGDVDLVVYQGAADLGFLIDVGIKAIIFGPGEKSVMHMPDEYCRYAQISEAVELYHQIIQKWSRG